MKPGGRSRAFIIKEGVYAAVEERDSLLLHPLFPTQQMGVKN